ncbi:MAG: hypothetical protein HN348_28925 [Proteobacteria bacterium]|nr:hypothetical protein [Pseudomonadota bacterium]
MLPLLLALLLAVPTFAADEPFAPYDQAMESGDKTTAADELVAIIDDKKQGKVHSEALVKLGELLVSFDLPYAALMAYSKAMELDTTPAEPQMSKILGLTHDLRDELLISPTLANNLDMEVDDESRAFIGLLVARHFTRKSDYGAATAALYLVPPESAIYAEAQALQGVVLAQQGRYGDALAPLVTAQTVAKTDVLKDQDFQDLTNLNLGRAYFGAENWGQSMAAYAKVSRNSPYWAEANFERAWSHFRAEDMAGTIGLLYTHESPFFEGWLFAEADLLRAYALFLMCKFPEATKRIDAFAQDYEPIKAELDAALATATPKAAFSDVVAAKEGGAPASFPLMIIRKFTWEERFDDAVTARAVAKDEIRELRGAGGHVFAERATTWLEERRDEIAAVEGQRVIEQARLSQTDLAEMLTGIEITRLDLLNFETQMYERAAQTGELDFGDRLGKLRRLRKKRGVWVWPFQGEYWEDELGWYYIDARPDCPADLAAGEQ